jgi:hypothetical protein
MHLFSFFSKSLSAQNTVEAPLSSEPGPRDDAWNQESKGQKLKSRDETSLKQLSRQETPNIPKQCGGEYKDNVFIMLI